MYSMPLNITLAQCSLICSSRGSRVSRGCKRSAVLVGVVESLGAVKVVVVGVEMVGACTDLDVCIAPVMPKYNDPIIQTT